MSIKNIDYYNNYLFGDRFQDKNEDGDRRKVKYFLADAYQAIVRVSYLSSLNEIHNTLFV
ncbi:MAG: hypothetical protein AAF915_22325 [Cyanobacteria bacterium P01_D01_bin.50]